MHNNRIKMLCLAILLAWLLAGCQDSAAQETELWVKESETDGEAAERRQETAEQTTEAAQLCLRRSEASGRLYRGTRSQSL